MNLEEYRQKESEKERISDILELIENPSQSVADIGCRDGFLTQFLTEYFEHVTALDLNMPTIQHNKGNLCKG